MRKWVYLAVEPTPVSGDLKRQLDAGSDLTLEWLSLI
jgi:hypothetical protein